MGFIVFVPFFIHIIMALELKLTYTQSKDNKILTFTDASGIYDANNLGGWGTPNPSVTDIDGVAHTLTLDVVKRGIDNADTTYDTIDLYDLAGPFATVEDLIFPITGDMLVSNGTGASAVGEVLADGIYEFTYKYDKGLGTEASLIGTLLITGVVETEVYSLLSNIPDVYNQDNYKSRKIDFTIFSYSYLQSILSASYLSKTDDILRSLTTLQKLITNGNNSTF